MSQNGLETQLVCAIANINVKPHYNMRAINTLKHMRLM